MKFENGHVVENKDQRDKTKINVTKWNESQKV